MEYKPRLKIWQGSNRKNEFNPETFEAKSYGWWIYVKKIKGKVIFNNYSYSVTTNGHQYEMRSFLKEIMKIKKMIVVNQKESLSNGILIDNHYKTLALAEVRFKAPNRRKDYYLEQKSIIKKMKNEIKMLKKLGAKSNNSLTSYRKQAKLNENERLTLQREKSKISREKRKEVLAIFKAPYESLDAVTI